MIIADTSGLLAALHCERAAPSGGCRLHRRPVANEFVVSPFVVAELDYLVSTTRNGVAIELTMLRELASGAYELRPPLRRRPQRLRRRHRAIRRPGHRGHRRVARRARQALRDSTDSDPRSSALRGRCDRSTAADSRSCQVDGSALCVAWTAWRTTRPASRDGLSPEEAALLRDAAKAERYQTMRDRGRQIGGVPGAIVAGLMVALRDIYESPKRDVGVPMVEVPGEPHDVDRDGMALSAADIGGGDDVTRRRSRAAPTDRRRPPPEIAAPLAALSSIRVQGVIRVSAAGRVGRKHSVGPKHSDFRGSG